MARSIVAGVPRAEGRALPIVATAQRADPAFVIDAGRTIGTIEVIAARHGAHATGIMRAASAALDALALGRATAAYQASVGTDAFIIVITAAEHAAEDPNGEVREHRMSHGEHDIEVSQRVNGDSSRRML
jgi:hypothetical protein